MGRLKIVAGQYDDRRAQVLVVPDDGSEPIALPTMNVKVTGGVDDYVKARIDCRVTEIDISGKEMVPHPRLGHVPKTLGGLRITGKAQKAGRSLTGNRFAASRDGAPILVKRFSWRLRWYGANTIRVFGERS